MLDKENQTNEECVSLAISILCYILFCCLFVLKDSVVSVVIYALIMVFSLFKKNKGIPLMLLGVVNFLPAIYGISPLVVCTIIIFMMCIKVFFFESVVVLKKIPSSYIFLLLMIVSFSLLTSTIYNDYSFFIDLLTVSIFLGILYFWVCSNRVNSNFMLNHFIIGLRTGIILTFFIKMDIPGYVSTQPDRLAIGERADPNSTGLLFAILCIFTFIKFYDELKSKNKTAIINGLLLVASMVCLFFTQSRGSLICIIITMLLFMVFRKEKNGESMLFLCKKSIILLLILVVISFLFSTIAEFAVRSWKMFYDRIVNPVSQDGERLYLLEMSIKSLVDNPFIGVTLEEFKGSAGHLPHNSFSDYMVTNGIVGIVFYVFFFFRPMTHILKIRGVEDVEAPFYVFFICALNVLFYSASNEKIIFFLLMIYLFSLQEAKGKKKI